MMLAFSHVEVFLNFFYATLIDDSDDSGKFSYDTKLIKNFAKRRFIRCFRTEVPDKLDIIYRPPLCIME